MKIPEYAYYVASIFNVSDSELSERWGQFIEARFTVLENQSLREFFLGLTLKGGIKQAIKLCEFISSEFRVPKTLHVQYKHEWVLLYLNSLSLERAKNVILYALVHIEDNLNTIRQLSKGLIKRASKEVKVVKPFRFI